MSSISETLEYLIKAIVTDPTSIVITTGEENGILILEVAASSEIVGQIIGKEGKIIKALRTILNLSYPDIRYSLEIKE